MYSIQKAAAVLGVAESTVRSWMKRFGIKGKLIETDRRRKYLTHNDMLTIMDRIYDKESVDKKEAINRRLNNNYVILDDKDAYYSMNTGERFYSLAGAASLLGVAVNTVQIWIKQHNIRKKVISTDRKRTYISHNDVVRLAHLYKREVPFKEHTAIPPQREVNAVQNDENKLYSIREAALCLNVLPKTIRRWIKKDNIETKIENTGIRLKCITYKDVLRLADLHDRQLVLNSSPVDVVGEIEEIKKMLKQHASDIEDLKHDFRLFVKRSIYVKFD